MKITKLETFLTNAGLRNYLFVRLTTDSGITGLGEASLEWQEKTVETLIHEWVKDRILGEDPFDIERIIGNMIRDQYQGGSTIMTAISSIEVALWDIIGKACGQPVYKLLGGRVHNELPAYANGWYGGARKPDEYAVKAKEAVGRGYCGLKFDPFGCAWKSMSSSEMKDVESLVEAVRIAVGDDIEIMIEVHGRLGKQSAIEMARRLEKYRPAWYEEPVVPDAIDLLPQVKAATFIPIAAGERLYSLQDFDRLISIQGCDVLQMDPSHCGGLHIAKKVAALADVKDIVISPHCSIGPVALAAAIHLDWSTPNFRIQENFAEYDVPWRDSLVYNFNPIENGHFKLPDKPGLGLELNEAACAEHPYIQNSFPSLWDKTWLNDFTQNERQ